jgi:hypothetical protein
MSGVWPAFAFAWKGWGNMHDRHVVMVLTFCNKESVPPSERSLYTQMGHYHSTLHFVIIFFLPRFFLFFEKY